MHAPFILIEKVFTCGGKLMLIERWVISVFGIFVLSKLYVCLFDQKFCSILDSPPCTLPSCAMYCVCISQAFAMCLVLKDLWLNIIMVAWQCFSYLCADAVHCFLFLREGARGK